MHGGDRSRCSSCRPGELMPECVTGESQDQLSDESEGEEGRVSEWKTPLKRRCEE